jgi:hypothetical protein
MLMRRFVVAAALTGLVGTLAAIAAQSPATLSLRTQSANPFGAPTAD